MRRSTGLAGLALLGVLGTTGCSGKQDEAAPAVPAPTTTIVTPAPTTTTTEAPPITGTTTTPTTSTTTHTSVTTSTGGKTTTTDKAGAKPKTGTMSSGSASGKPVASAGTPTPGPTDSSVTILQAIQNKIKADTSLAGVSVRAEQKVDNVVLTGTVSKPEQKDTIETIVYDLEKARGMKPSVEDNLDVK